MVHFIHWIKIIASVVSPENLTRALLRAVYVTLHPLKFSFQFNLQKSTTSNQLSNTIHYGWLDHKKHEKRELTHRCIAKTRSVTPSFKTTPATRFNHLYPIEQTLLPPFVVPPAAA